MGGCAEVTVLSLLLRSRSTAVPPTPQRVYRTPQGVPDPTGCTGPHGVPGHARCTTWPCPLYYLAMPAIVNLSLAVIVNLSLAVIVNLSLAELVNLSLAELVNLSLAVQV